MDDTPETPPASDDLDPALIEAMRERVVVRKPQDYGKRKAGPGRPKGSSKPPGSGKKAGTPNVMTPEFRTWLADRAKPFEVLAAICAGEEIEDGGIKRKPTVSERMRAAETLARKLLPDLAATSISGANGGPVGITVAPEPMNNFELARRIAFALAQGVEDMQDAERAAPRAKLHEVPRVGKFADPPATPVNSANLPNSNAPEPQQVGDYEISFAERLPGDRERWAIRDGAGRLVGTAFGREAAALKARNLESEGLK